MSRRLLATASAWMLLGCYGSHVDEPDADGGETGVPEAWPDSLDAADAIADAEGVVDSGPCPSGMALVPAGPFLMGCRWDDGDPVEYRQCDHTLGGVPVTLSSYCIDLTEVTNAAYAACVASGSCEPPDRVDNQTLRPHYYDNPEFADYPVVWVSPLDAETYCRWLGRRLPSEAEWEKAGRGGCEIVAPETCGPEDGRMFPWGDSPPTCDQAEHWDCGPEPGRRGITHPVGSLPAGASPYGVLDMVDNIREITGTWTEEEASASDPESWWYLNCASGCTDPAGPDPPDPPFQAKEVRGFLSGDQALWMPLPFRTSRLPVNQSYSREGFRCAADARE